VTCAVGFVSDDIAAGRAGITETSELSQPKPAPSRSSTRHERAVALVMRRNADQFAGMATAAIDFAGLMR
jgi:hypothetical protein